MDKLLRGLPWWVKWVAVPVIALVVFGTLIAALVSFVIGLLFKVIVFVILVGALVLVVKRVTSGGGPRTPRAATGDAGSPPTSPSRRRWPTPPAAAVRPGRGPLSPAPPATATVGGTFAFAHAGARSTGLRGR